VAAREGRPAVSLPRPLTTRLQTAYDFWCGAIRQSCPTIKATGQTSVATETG
jgi:hypothetical protein